MAVMRDVRERTCPLCGRVFAPQSVNAKYCSDACRREHDRRRAREDRRRGAKPKREHVDRYLAGTGAVHDELMAMRRETGMKY